MVRGGRHRGCVTLGMSLYLSESPFPCLHNGDHPSQDALFSVDCYHLPVGRGASGGLTLAWEMEAERGLGWRLPCVSDGKNLCGPIPGHWGDSRTAPMLEQNSWRARERRSYFPECSRQKGCHMPRRDRGCD